MTNYKRFISYLNYYENGQKKGNVGFARVESSDELCKFTVHCGLKSVPKKICKVYLLRRQTSLILSEEVGAAEVRNGILDIKISFERGIIVPNDFEFKECIGIVLMYSKDNYIGAKWDESPITYHEASLIEQVANKEKTKLNGIEPNQIQVEESKKQEELPRVEPEKLEKLPQQEPKRQEELLREEPKEQEELPQVEPEKQEKPPKEEPEKSTGGKIGPKNCEVEEPPVSIRDLMNKKAMVQIIPEEEIKIIDMKEEELVVKSDIQKEVSSISEEDVQCESIGKQENEVINEDLNGEENKVNEEDDEKVVSATGGSAAAALNMSQWVDHPAARAILNRFVRMYPFDDGEIAECVRLEPKDIGLFPMTAWPLGNNSFVLHSYCNFRHLLFAKKLTREGCVYYLMVPGTLNARERQLARMFGFEDFKCSRRRSMRDGEFGYWYIPIYFN